MLCYYTAMVFYIYSLQHVQNRHLVNMFNLPIHSIMLMLYTHVTYAQTWSRVNIQDVHGQGHYLGANMHEQIMFDAVSCW